MLGLANLQHEFRLKASSCDESDFLHRQRANELEMKSVLATYLSPCKEDNCCRLSRPKALDLEADTAERAAPTWGGIIAPNTIWANPLGTKTL